MKNLITILCLCLFWLSFESPTETEDLSYYDLYCSEGYVELWGNYYDIETTTELHKYTGGDIEGIIPPHIECLTNLTSLILRDNEFTGGIPPEIWNLTNLTELNLHGSQLSGEIPPEIGNLTNLEELDLSGNEFTGEIPSEICNHGNSRRYYSPNVRLNKFCPPYPSCLSQLDIILQDTTNCP